MQHTVKDQIFKPNSQDNQCTYNVSYALCIGFVAHLLWTNSCDLLTHMIQGCSIGCVAVIIVRLLDCHWSYHYKDVIMGAIAYQNTSPTIFYSTVYSDADQRKRQSSASLAFVRGIHRRPVNSPHKWPVTRKMFPFDDIIVTLKAKTACVGKA